MKSVTVTMLCQNVDSDGFPVNQRGETFGRGWEKMLTWEPKRRPASSFCPRGLEAGKRRVSSTAKGIPRKCLCHGKMRLVQ